MKKSISLLLIISILSSLSIPVIAKTEITSSFSMENQILFPVIETMDNSSQCITLDYEYANSDQYGIGVPETVGGKSSSTEDYAWLQGLLSDKVVIWSNEALDIYTYDISVSQLLNINNLAELVEIASIGDSYTVTYHTIDGEYVTVEYLSDGTKNTFVREAAVVDTKGDSDEPRVISYNGQDQSVSEQIFSTSAPEQARAAKKVDYPTPAQVGFRDTGTEGEISTSTSVYIDALSKYHVARVMEYECEYTKQGSGWLPYAATTSLSLIATTMGWTAGTLASYLSGVGVAIAIIAGMYKLKEDISLQKYTDYTSTYGQYGVIKDSSVYVNEFCVVIQNVGSAEYVGGITSKGEFDYVRRNAQGLKDDNYIIDRTKYLYNACIISYGHNEMYSPLYNYWR